MYQGNGLSKFQRKLDGRMIHEYSIIWDKQRAVMAVLDQHRLQFLLLRLYNQIRSRF
jgi:hypothetical protein